MAIYHEVSFSYVTYQDAHEAEPAGQFAVPFPYLATAHVAAFVNGSPVEFTWTTSSLIQVDSEDLVVNEDGECNLRIRRLTPASEMLTVFASPSNFRPVQVNNAFLQLLYILQEAFDASLEALILAQEIAQTHAAVLAALSQVQAILAQVQQIRDDFDDEAAALLLQVQEMIAQIEAVWQNTTMDVAVSVPYRTGRNEVVASFQFAEQWTLLEDAEGSKAWALSPGAAVSTIIKLIHIDAAQVETEFATVTFAAEANSGTFSEFSEKTFLPGETLKLQVDEDADADFRHWGLVLRTYRYPPVVEA